MQTAGRSAPAIAVLGTSGKTTTILLTCFILEQLGLKPAALDVWRGPQALSRFKDRAAAAASDCLLVEIPMAVLRQKQPDAVFFQAAALTNLYPGPSEAGWQLSAASGFFDGLAEEARAVFNADNRLALGIAGERHQDFITFATDYPNAMVVAENIASQGLASRFDLAVQGDFTSLSGQVVMPGSCQVTLPAGGRHNISNSLLSASLCLLLGQELAAVAGAMARFPGIRRNLEVIHHSDFTIIDDGAQHPGAVRAVLETVTQLPMRRLILIHGITGGGGVPLNAAMAAELADWARRGKIAFLILTRSMYHCSRRHQVQVAEEKACLGRLREEGADFAYFPDLPDALESALWQAGPGDLVLLLGGPVLNRAAGLLPGLLLVENTASTLVPSRLESVSLYPGPAQPVPANPT